MIAGVCIAIGGYAYLMAETKILGALLFSVGLFLICVMGFNLYTGKIGFLYTDDTINIRYVLFVLITNMLGAFLVGLITRITNPTLINKAVDICKIKLSETPWQIILLGMLCNIMIYFAVYIFKYASHDFVKIFAIVICVTIFVFCGFEHCVANMYYFTVAGISRDCISFLSLNILGNTIGGILMLLFNKLRRVN